MIESIADVISTAVAGDGGSSTAFVRRGELRGLFSIFGLEDADRLLCIRGLSPESAFLLNGKKGLAKLSFYPWCDGFTRIYSPARIIAAMTAEGSTLVLRGLERGHPNVACVFRALRQRFAEPEHMACFISPPHSQTTVPHADDHPSVIVQLHGQKRWSVWGPVDESTIASAASLSDLQRRFELLAKNCAPVIDTVLEVGDALFVPQRHLHATGTDDCWSASVSFQLHPVGGKRSDVRHIAEPTDTEEEVL